MDLAYEFFQEEIKDDTRCITQGEVVKVYTKFKEDEKERVGVFEGVVIKIRGRGINKTFTIRRISSGIGVERIFPLYSKNIIKIEKLKKLRVRRAKLYYMRRLKTKLY